PISPMRSLGWMCQVASRTIIRAPNSKVTFCSPANMGAKLTKSVPCIKIRSMKKFILLAIVFLAAGFLAWKLLSDKPVRPAEPADKPLAISKNPGVFNDSFAVLLNNYFAVRDALVDWDTMKADQAAYSLAARADSLPVRLIKADSGIILTAK